MTTLTAEMNGEVRELTVAEQNMVVGGARNYDFVILGIHFWGDGLTYRCMAWDDANGGRTGFCS